MNFTDCDLNLLNINDYAIHDKKPCIILKFKKCGRVQIFKENKKSTVNPMKLIKINESEYNMLINTKSVIIDDVGDLNDNHDLEKINNDHKINDTDSENSDNNDNHLNKRKKRKYNSKEQAKKNYSFYGNNKCILTNEGPIEMAHIIPLDEFNDESINMIPLRGDLHSSFDMYKWCINPKGEELTDEDIKKWPFTQFGDFKKHKILISHKTPKWFSIYNYKDNYLPIFVESQKYLDLAFENFNNENNAK
jgi:hypothetical protein